MPAEVVQLHDSPALNDIPGQLRQLADHIEAGQHGDVTAMMVLIPRGEDYPIMFGWGDIEGIHHPIIQLEFAKAYFVNHMTERT